DYEVTFRAGGEVIATSTVTITGGAASTVVAFGTPDDITVNVYPDAIANVTPDQAALSVINAISGETTVSLSLEDGTTLADDLAAGEASEVTSVDPVQGIPNGAITIAGTSTALDLP